LGFCIALAVSELVVSLLSVKPTGYAGIIISHFGIAIGLNSLWALIPVGLFTSLFIIRTFLEDTALIRELPGYTDYAAKVKYRLFQGIW